MFHGLSLPVIVDIPVSHVSKYEREDIQVNTHLFSVYRSGEVVNADGQKVKFADVTNPIEGDTGLIF